MSRAVIIMLASCVAVLAGFGVAVAIVVTPFVIGLALLLLLVYVVFFAVLVYIYVTNKYFLPTVRKLLSSVAIRFCSYICLCVVCSPGVWLLLHSA